MKTLIGTIFVVMMSTTKGLRRNFAADWRMVCHSRHRQSRRVDTDRLGSRKTRLDLPKRQGVEGGSRDEYSVQERAVNFNRGIPTTRMGFGSEPANSTLEDWTVADGGKTLFAHSEMFEGRHDRRWIERISSSPTIRFSFDTPDSTFQTGQLAQALQSAGCTY